MEDVGSRCFGFFIEERSKERHTMTSKAPWPVVCSERPCEGSSTSHAPDPGGFGCHFPAVFNSEAQY